MNSEPITFTVTEQQLDTLGAALTASENYSHEGFTYDAHLSLANAVAAFIGELEQAQALNTLRAAIGLLYPGE